ncbi:MAG: glycoside hydrolase family 68 protein [Actinobacteria bacterium]|nr:glycoside hydrolase family 68 protein [Actinomycetota bacterium]
MLQIEDTWTWDFWIADTGEIYHIFFLRAPKTCDCGERHNMVRNPDERHGEAAIGHATSRDLINWKLHPNIFKPSKDESFDDKATWTGSVIKCRDGIWYMFYTGISQKEGGLIQRIGLATSSDLYDWEKRQDFHTLTADQRWYERLGESTWPNETWRDPWVFADPGGDGWHMLITARANKGVEDDRGVIGHARSADLMHWEVLPPLSEPGSGFGDLEVTQLSVVDGRPVLLFSCITREFSIGRKAVGPTGGGCGGVWAVPSKNILGPFDIEGALLITDDKLYAGRIVQDRIGRWLFLAFVNGDGHGSFIGRLNDPLSFSWDHKGIVSLRVT